MGGLNLRVSSGKVAMVAATAKTVLQVQPSANTRFKVRGFRITMKNANPGSEGVFVRILKQDGAGAFAGTVVAKPENMSETEAVQTVFNVNASGEPAVQDIMDEFYVFAGYVEILPFGNEISIPPGQRLGFEVTAAAVTDVTVSILGTE